MRRLATTTKRLYDTDFVEWSARTAQLLREGRFDEVDLEHLAEEILDLGGSERSALDSQMGRMLMHLSKQRIQPDRDGRNWKVAILDARREMESRIDQSPSLLRDLEDALAKIYRRAVRDALDETGLKDRLDELDIPPQCPWTVAELLEGDTDDLEKTS